MRRKWQKFLGAGLLAFLLLQTNTAEAVDFKVKGIWINMLEYGNGGNFITKDRAGRRQNGWGKWNEDEFEAKTRVRLQLNAQASENLSGTVYFEIGAVPWGQGNKGGALGADGTIVKIKHAYLDFVLPNTELKTRMGIQRMYLHDYATEASQVFDADVAGINTTLPLGEHASLTAFWARPFNDNYDGGTDPAKTHYLDNADLFGLVLPLQFDGLDLSAFTMLGAFGRNAYRTSVGADSWYYGKDGATDYSLGLSPAAYAKGGRENVFDYATAFWGGITAQLTAFDPFRLAASFNYGTVETGEDALNRHGWYAGLMAEYKFDWGTPGIYGWYSSGDDDDPTNGSERLPNIEKNNESTSGFTSIATLGTWTIGRDAVLGSTLSGTWGFGARVRNFSFLENLSHTFRINYYQGTNSSDMARYIKGAPTRYDIVHPYGSDFNTANYYGVYLTDKDRALEFGLSSQYQIYDNLKLLVEANYINLALDQSSSVWGGFTDATGTYQHANSIEDMWNVNLSLIYKF